MKIKILSLIIMAVIAAACQGKPQLKFSEAAHDFGKVKQETALSHVFRFINEGDSVLVIHEVKGG